MEELINKVREWLSSARAFLQIDKVAHILASALICLSLGGWMMMRLDFRCDAVIVPYIFAPMVTFFIGMGKECYDHYTGASDEPGDLKADLIGIVIALVLMLLIFA